LNQIDELKKKLSAGGSNSQGQRENTRTTQADESSTELKVVGQVSAGRIRSTSPPTHSETSNPLSGNSPSAPTSPIRPPQDAPKKAQPITSPTLETDHSVEPMRKITVEEAFEQWQQWVGEVRNTKIGIGTILGESHIVDVTDGALRIGCPDDYHLSSLKRHKEFLVDSFQKITGLKLRIEPVLSTNPGNGHAVHPDASSAKRPAGSQMQQQNLGNSGPGEHPTLLALRRELGAEPID
jgi:hypothetical protein